MMGKVVIPKFHIDVSGERVIFLAGPIGNAPNWHDKAMEIIFDSDSSVTIASPRRVVEDPELAKYIAGSNVESFPRQRVWEWHYQEKAAKKGAIMFWLPGEDVNCREYDPKKVYGAMTRMELGQWMTRYKFEPSVKTCFGSDGNFPELHTIAYDLSIHAPEKKIYSSLEETCAEALRLSRL